MHISPNVSTRYTVRNTAPFNAPQVQFAGAQSPEDDKAPQKAKKKKYNPKTFVTPRPKKLVMRLLTPMNYAVERGLLSAIPGLRNIPYLGTGIANVRYINFPSQDLARLKTAVNPNTAAFMGPNHPEFFTDWLLDKHISTKVAPDMASWAAEGFVNGMGPLMQRFWLSNNLIAHTGGQAAKDYSVEWAMQGKAVLLHPEGNVYWTGDKVHFIFDGIVDMPIAANKQRAALEAEWKAVEKSIAEVTVQNRLTYPMPKAVRKQLDELKARKTELLAQGAARPVHIAPLIWKLHFNSDVSAGLHKEMSKIENKLDLPSGNWDETPVERFMELQINLLKRQEVLFKLPQADQQQPVSGKTFFARQEKFRDFLVAQVAEAVKAQAPETTLSEDKETKIRQLGKAVSKQITQIKETKAPKTEATAKWFELKDMLDEVDRLNGFTTECYNQPTLTQENISESLKRIIQRMFYGGYGDGAERMTPAPVGDRTAHIRVPESINLTELLKGRTEVSDTERDALVAEVKKRMQDTLDKLNQEIESKVAPFRVANPFYVAPGEAKSSEPALPALPQDIPVAVAVPNKND